MIVLPDRFLAIYKNISYKGIGELRIKRPTIMIYKIRRVRHFCLTFIMNRQKCLFHRKKIIYKSLRSLA